MNFEKALTLIGLSHSETRTKREFPEENVAADESSHVVADFQISAVFDCVIKTRDGWWHMA